MILPTAERVKTVAALILEPAPTPSRLATLTSAPNREADFGDNLGYSGLDDVLVVVGRFLRTGFNICAETHRTPARASVATCSAFIALQILLQFHEVVLDPGPDCTDS